MVTVQVSTMTLCQLLDGKFSMCAVEVIAEWLDENKSSLDFIPTIGDIYIMFSEVEEGDKVVAHLPNGKVLTCSGESRLFSFLLLW